MESSNVDVIELRTPDGHLVAEWPIPFGVPGIGEELVLANAHSVYRVVSVRRVLWMDDARQVHQLHLTVICTITEMR